MGNPKRANEKCKGDIDASRERGERVLTWGETYFELFCFRQGFSLFLG